MTVLTKTYFSTACSLAPYTPARTSALLPPLDENCRLPVTMCVNPIPATLFFPSSHPPTPHLPLIYISSLLTLQLENFIEGLLRY